jgi:hypothetical protein
MNPTGAQSAYGFTPFTPDLTPPSGYYDPAIDAQVASTQRGYDDTADDAATAQRRAQQDYELGKTAIGTTYDRGMADIGTNRQQTTEDRDTAVANLERSYQRLGNSQRQAQNARGVLTGGARLQAAAKRAANEALDRAPIDTAYTRAISGLDTSATRLGEDRDTQLGQLGIGYGRQTDDTATALARAGRENEQFKIDARASAAQQAATAGWSPYALQPSNQFGQGASARQVVTRGNTVYVYGPDGRIIDTRKKAGV